MSDKTNHNYFAARAAAEFQLSRTATDPRARAAHAELAKRYADLADEFLGDGPPPPRPELRILT
jgi:hypothetical protein